ncbi:hypothetical protein P4V41_07485 [Fictibacillus nanhaiensis]|uniref:hypothetical protein n=1 Tax=Fictibacillus nanhaiensis TaxID=742169 RepID=UPI002E1C01DF|nr:hypothetical protein [Fictibacillus nanhaiensis]
MTETQLFLLRSHAEKHNDPDMLWLIEQAEKVWKLEEAINYVLTAEPSHYHNMKNMLEDFKTVINMTIKD